MRRDGTQAKKREDREKEYRPLVPALDQAIKVLFHLQKHSGEPMTLTTICRGVSIHKSKGHSILSTLHRYGFVERDPQAKTYTLGARLIPLARSVLDHLDFRTVSTPFIEQLAKETGMTVWFGARLDETLFVVSKYEGGGHFWATPGIGQSFTITEGAHGKAILAFLPEEELKKLVPQKRLSEGFRRELASVRQRGYATDLGEFAKGITGIGAPVFGPAGQVVGVVLLFGVFPEEKAEGYGKKTALAARQISQKLGN